MRTGSIPACAGEPPRRPARRGSTQVYPRVCGGTPPGPALRRRRRGLSPRVRGNRPESAGRRQPSRSIPACAGEPVVLGLLSTAATVYPRVCGGTCYLLSSRIKSVGLSPRVRGNLPTPEVSHLTPRSIPACAGEPASVANGWDTSWVYPRVCGGTEQVGAADAVIGGLSPRVRGNPDPEPDHTRLARSIPACAGEPLSVMWCEFDFRVYPRVCGGTWCPQC